MKEGMSREEVRQIVLSGAPRIAAEALHTPLGDFIARLCRRTNEARFDSALAARAHLSQLPK